MAIGFLRERFLTARREPALVWRDEELTYGALLGHLDYWVGELGSRGVRPGSVVSLEADFSPNAVALMLALIEEKCTIVPLTSSVEAQKPEFREVAEVQVCVRLSEGDTADFETRSVEPAHPILLGLKDRGHPGLVLFSSGSTGKSKAAVHDFVPLLEKFHVRRPSLRTITFLLFDHIGGVNTMLHTLSNSGCIVTVASRSPEAVCAAIERHRVQVLPTSPTFLNLLLLSGAPRRHDLSSLELITYGTEPMAETTLLRLREALPSVRLQQTYGLSELGIMRSKSRSSDSLWVKVGGEGFQTRVVDGLLEIHAKSAMLGYLNAPDPFTDDGWFRTGDAVEVDGEYLRILGRESETINVGGEKVHPAEVEGVLQTLEGVEDVAVSAESHPLTGQIVKARVKLARDEPLPEFRRRMRAWCRDRLARFKIPQKVVLVREPLHGGRFKKMRRES